MQALTSARTYIAKRNLRVRRIEQSGSNLRLLGKVFPLQTLGKKIEILNKAFNFKGLSVINDPGMIIAELVLPYININTHTINRATLPLPEPSLLEGEGRMDISVGFTPPFSTFH